MNNKSVLITGGTGSLGKSLTTRKSKGFYYPPAPVSENWDDEAQGFGSKSNSAE